MLFTLFKGQEENKTNRKVDKNFKNEKPNNPLPNHALVIFSHHDAQITCPS